MNWEAAKTWLIAAFFILDLVLGYQWIEGRTQIEGYVESPADLLANTKTLLADHGFGLQSEIPGNHPDMPTLQGTFPDVSLQELVQAAFPDAQSAVINPGVSASTTSGIIRLLPDGGWAVTYTSPIQNPKGGQSSWLARVWRGTVYNRDTGLMPASNTIVFEQQFHAYPIFDATVLVYVKNGHMGGYTQTELSNVTDVGEPKPIITATDALTSLANSVDKSSDPKDNRVLSIELGYTHKVSVSPEASSNSDANYWFPVWRIVTNQQVYFVNAYTGEVDTLS